jgi:hypothetical protein
MIFKKQKNWPSLKTLFVSLSRKTKGNNRTSPNNGPLHFFYKTLISKHKY